MIKQEAQKRIFENIFNKKLINLFDLEKFKHNKSKHEFVLNVNEFQMITRFNIGRSGIIKEHGKAYLNIVFNTYVECKKLMKWFKTTHGVECNPRFSYHFCYMNFFTEINESEITIDDFYEPSAAIKFKNYVSSMISNDKDNIEVKESLQDFIDLKLESMINDTIKICDFERLFNIINEEPNIDAVNLALTFNDLEKAIESHQKLFDNILWLYYKYKQEGTNHFTAESVYQFAKRGKILLGVDYVIPNDIN